jgi:tetratricopeptide (TPR) repeat protein
VARITRKELKKDEIVLEVSKTVELFQAHRERLMIVGIVAGVVLLTALGGYLIYDKRMSNANEALGKAMLTYHAPVKPPSPTPEEAKSFVTEKEKYTTAVREFLPVAQKYSWLKPGLIARYYAGLCQANLDNFTEAEKELNAVIRTGNENLAPLARLALANTMVRAGRPADAEQFYRQLIDHPSSTVPKITAQLALAAQIRTTKPAEAEKIYKDIEAAKPSSTVLDYARQGLAALKK